MLRYIKELKYTKEMNHKMLDLHNILWVIPGVIFIHLYNIRRPEKSISLSGWPYLFFLVVFATLTWLPSEFIVQTNFLKIKTFFISIFNSNEKIIILLVSIFLSVIWFLFAQWKWVTQWIFLSTHDNFHKQCIKWENEEILLTLKNGKAYHGVLWKYTENPKSRHESYTISIIPFKSGYRDEKIKKVIWNTYYPKYEDKSNLSNMEMIIPRTEIITFGKFNKEVFKYFYKE